MPIRHSQRRLRRRLHLLKIFLPFREWAEYDLTVVALIVQDVRRPSILTPDFVQFAHLALRAYATLADINPFAHLCPRLAALPSTSLHSQDIEATTDHPLTTAPTVEEAAAYIAHAHSHSITHQATIPAYRSGIANPGEPD